LRPAKSVTLTFKFTHSPLWLATSSGQVSGHATVMPNGTHVEIPVIRLLQTRTVAASPKL